MIYSRQLITSSTPSDILDKMSKFTNRNLTIIGFQFLETLFLFPFGVQFPKEPDSELPSFYKRTFITFNIILPTRLIFKKAIYNASNNIFTW